MNKTAIKNYAIWARVTLIEAVKQRAYQYEITKDSITDANADVVSGKPLTKEEKEQRRQLIDQINRKGFDQVMEEVAYTWFNRFIALRFMEVNGYLPTKVRVFTDAEGNFKPEILKEALTVELPVDKSRVMDLLEKQDNEELYKLLLIAQCNELSNGLPDMFEVISNYTELLFPNNLLKEDSIVGEMINTIPKDDWTDAVQIIGWLYQYYNSELKDETFALLKKNIRVTKDTISAVTQLFTPDWIVRYMVENSLGRLWYEGHPNDEIKKEWKYYLDEAEQEPEVEEQLKAIREKYKAIKPEDIKVIDPCMGSGHILVYAFDVLMQIYTAAGWSEREAAESILENNIYGLDIDDRAGQLAYFAVMMKARKYSRRILTKNIKPKVYSIQESNNVKIEAWWRLGPEEDIARRLVQDLTDAKEYGSIINLSVSTAELQTLRKRLDDIEEMSDQGNLLDVIQSDEITRQLYPLIEIAEVMVRKYDVVVTNPPYMGNGSMSVKLSDYVKENYPDSKSDLFACFIEKGFGLIKSNSFNSMVTMQSWMFLSSFEKTRRNILQYQINSLIRIGYNSFPELNSQVAHACAFVMRKNSGSNYLGKYYELNTGKSSDDKKRVFEQRLEKNDVYIRSNKQYKSIPSSPIAFWMSEKMYGSFQLPNISTLASTNNGFTTGNNDLFIRFWSEVSASKICFDNPSLEALQYCSKKWFPYNKGGNFRKWYGNNDYVINWENDGADIKNYGHLVPRSLKYQFKESVSWNKINTDSNGFRYKPVGTMFDVGGLSMFSSPHKHLIFLLALCNSVYAQKVLEIISPTVNCETGHVSSIPVNMQSVDSVVELSNRNIAVSKQDWDSYETSWDFKKNPLI